MKLKVITLNCWGIPWSIPNISSPNRLKRFDAIGEFLASEKYDFVFLQEVWDEQDYLTLSRKLLNNLPHSFYFKTGIIGSGTCIFSVAPIDKVFNKTFSINGFPHQVWRGDGLAGAGVGAAQVTLEGKRILVCVTHFHAEYYGQFQSDRAAQAWEVRNFVKLMDEGDMFDLLIIAGDFNSLPGELPHNILTSCLTDCWQGNYSTTFGNTKNSYAGKDEEETLDYIFIKDGSTVDVTVQKTCLPLEHVIPGGDVSYSDHEAVQTELWIRRKEKILETEDKEICSENGNKEICLEIKNQKLGSDTKNGQECENKNNLNKMHEVTLEALILSMKYDLFKTDGYQFEYLAMSFVILVFMLFFQNWLFNSAMAFAFCFCFTVATFTLQSRKVTLQHILQQIDLDKLIGKKKLNN